MFNSFTNVFSNEDNLINENTKNHGNLYNKFVFISRDLILLSIVYVNVYDMVNLVRFFLEI